MLPWYSLTVKNRGRMLLWKVVRTPKLCARSENSRTARCGTIHRAASLSLSECAQDGSRRACAVIIKSRVLSACAPGASQRPRPPTSLAMTSPRAATSPGAARRHRNHVCRRRHQHPRAARRRRLHPGVTCRRPHESWSKSQAARWRRHPDPPGCPHPSALPIVASATSPQCRTASLAARASIPPPPMRMRRAA